MHAAYLPVIMQIAANVTPAASHVSASMKSSRKVILLGVQSSGLTQLLLCKNMNVR